jgi:hypothetical protein
LENNATPIVSRFNLGILGIYCLIVWLIIVIPLEFFKGMFIVVPNVSITLAPWWPMELLIALLSLFAGIMLFVKNKKSVLLVRALLIVLFVSEFIIHAIRLERIYGVSTEITIADFPYIFFLAFIYIFMGKSKSLKKHFEKEMNT